MYKDATPEMIDEVMDKAWIAFQQYIKLAEERAGLGTDNCISISC